MFRLALPIACALSFLASGQTMPGQYPGQYPGRYPTGGTQIPGTRLPGQTGGQRIPGQTPGSRGGNTRSTPSKSAAPVNLTTTLGILRQTTPNFLVLEADDHRIIWYRLAAMIEVQKEGKAAELSSFAQGDYLSVDSSSTDEGEFTAVSVTWRTAATDKDRFAVARTWDLPKLPNTPAKQSSAASVRGDDDRPIIRRKEKAPEPDKETAEKEAPAQQAQNQPPPAEEEKEEPVQPSTIVRPPAAPPDADDPGRPVLKRRTPGEVAARAAAQPVAIAKAGSAAAPASRPSQPKSAEPPQPAAAETLVILPDAPVDNVIEKAREATATYASSVPNFFAKQFTTRSRKLTSQRIWETIDVVTADVAYEDGKETYTNIKIGTKPANKPMEEIEGARSTGEFSSLLEDLFDPSTAAEFRRSGQTTLRNRPATLYNFEVPRERSHWRIVAVSQLYYPATKGSVWVDKETSRILRIEMQSRGLPPLFPFDTVETSVDYDFVRLGDMGFYLVPVEADALMCVRGTPDCNRNHIEFRNYRKFGSESGITFEEPAK